MNLPNTQFAVRRQVDPRVNQTIFPNTPVIFSTRETQDSSLSESPRSKKDSRDKLPKHSVRSQSSQRPVKVKASTSQTHLALIREWRDKNKKCKNKHKQPSAKRCCCLARALIKQRNGMKPNFVMIQPQVHLRLPCYDFYFL